MKIILQRQVANLGEPGEVVDVADGYARNFLIPRGLALRASGGALRHAERVRAVREGSAERDRETAEARVAELERSPVRVSAQAGEDGRLFGSITAQQLAEELSKTVGWRIDRRRIALDEPIRSTGVHTVRVHLHPEVNATVTVQVVKE
ncbi:MAG: 50S ribosomal protein L9 [Actinomycetota bacterium]